MSSRLSKNIRRVLTTSAIYLVASPAMAIEPLVLKDADFKTLDINQDGYLDSTESAAIPETAALLKQGDKDKDGRLSENEFRAAIKAPPPKG